MGYPTREMALKAMHKESINGETLYEMPSEEARHIVDRGGKLPTKLAVEAILQEHHDTHGDYTLDASVAMTLWKNITDVSGSQMTKVQAHAAFMICCKLARIAAGDPDFKDHWLDVAGYAKLAAERCTK